MARLRAAGFGYLVLATALRSAVLRDIESTCTREPAARAAQSWLREAWQTVEIARRGAVACEADPAPAHAALAAALADLERAGADPDAITAAIARVAVGRLVKAGGVYNTTARIAELIRERPMIER